MPGPISITVNTDVQPTQYFFQKGEPAMQRTIALSAALLAATLLLLIVIHGNIPAIAGQSAPNVTGKWEGTWRTPRGNSGQITIHLVQQGDKVTGKQNVVDVIPVWGTESAASTINIGEDVRDGEIEDSTLTFYVTAENVQGQINFTLTVSGDTMTGTACGYNCAKLKLKKSAM
jgi:hypothetical protein